MASVKELFPNVDAWGAKEWFQRLVTAVKARDEAACAQDALAHATHNNIASSSASWLAREFAAEISAALATTSEASALREERDALKARITALEQALEPFARVVSDDPDADSKFIWPSDPDHWDAYGQNWGKSIKVADCRRARSPTKPAGGAEPEPKRKPWPEPGDRMVFLNRNGYDHEREAAALIMAEGDTFTLKNIDIGSWSHTLEFHEIPGKRFNGVMFDYAQPAGGA